MIHYYNDPPTGRTRVEFQIPTNHGRHGRCSVVGSWNNWTPGVTPFRKLNAHAQRASVVLPEGLYEFRYLTEGGVWFDDDRTQLYNPDTGNNRLEVWDLAPVALRGPHPAVTG